MKLNITEQNSNNLILNISLYSFFPFLFSILAMIFPLLLMIISVSWLKLFGVLFFGSLGFFLLNAVMTKFYFNFDKKLNQIQISKKSLLGTSVQSYLISDLIKIFISSHLSASRGGVYLVQIEFKNNKTWKSQGTNLTQKQVQDLQLICDEVQRWSLY